MFIKNLNIEKKLIVDDMISFIITENCPYQCEHCMRDKRRPVTISKEVIDVVLSQVKINGIVHLGGGEPLTQVEMVVYLINRLYDLGNRPSGISVYTNGSVGPRKFEDFIIATVGKGVSLGLTVSNDYYHREERLRLNNGEDNIMPRIKEYQEIMYYNGYSRPIDDYLWMLEEYESFEKGKGVSAIGRGKNIPGARICKRQFKMSKNVSLEGNIIHGNIQVQPDGRITPTFDMSWEERDAHYNQEYNILNYPLEKILRRR